MDIGQEIFVRRDSRDCSYNIKCEIYKIFEGGTLNNASHYFLTILLGSLTLLDFMAEVVP